MAAPTPSAAPTSSALVSGDPLADDSEDREATRFEDIGVVFRERREEREETKSLPHLRLHKPALFNQKH
jgi:hypothetical protein